MRNALRTGRDRALWAVALLQALAIAGLAFAIAQRSRGEHEGASLRASAAPLEDRSTMPSARERAEAGGSAARDPGARSKSSSPERLHPSEATVAPSEGALLYGRILDGSGKPVERVSLRLRRVGDTEPWSEFRSHAQARFLYSGVPPGDFEIEGSATGFLPYAATIHIEAGVPRVEHEVVMQRARILAVRMLTPDDRPLMPALLELSKERRMALLIGSISAIATRAEPTGDLPLGSTVRPSFGSGRWRFESGPRELGLPKDSTGFFELRGSEPLWISALFRSSLLAKARVEAEQDVVTLRIDPAQVLARLGTVRLRVLHAETSQPLVGARVRLSDAHGGGIPVLADAEGRVELLHLQPAVLRLHVTTDTIDDQSLRLELAPGQIVDLGDLRFAPPQILRGRIENAIGKSEVLRLAATRLDPPPAGLLCGSISARVAPDGAFELRLPEGRYLVRASGAGGAMLEIESRDYREQPLVFSLAPEAPLRIEAQDLDQAVQLSLFDAQRRLVSRFWISDDARTQVACLPGAHELELQTLDGQVTRKSVLVPPEGFDLRLPD